MTSPRIIEFSDKTLVPLLFGARNAHIAYIEKKLGVSIADRGSRLTISGPDDAVDAAARLFETLWQRLQKGQDVSPAEIDAALRFGDKKASMNTMNDSNGKKPPQGPAIETRKKHIAPRTPGQARYVEMLRKTPMVFGLGPAGTGKTYLAVAVGVSMYLSGEVERLIFCRPAVEAGERLGFLPGDMKEKVDPYLRPIYDALHDMLPWDIAVKKMEIGEIEIAPLAFMRGRTLSNAFVILDEAQNTTPTQMKMFLTRMGESTRMVITGDLSQTDLPPNIKSGLRDATETLEGVDGIEFVHFTAQDVVRNPLVGRIIEAYDKRK